MRTSRAILSLVSNDPPTEFRMFKAGWNSTKKGKFLFDDEAAKSVMAAYKEHGVDRPIDLEHMSLDPKAGNWDPDARGWFKLEMRDGELWATDVRWTPDGAERLTNGKQRFISPCFAFDKETKRVSEVINAAICAIPATMDAPALVAASLLLGKTFGTLSVEATKMDEMKKILSALGLKDDATLEDCLASIKALQDDEGGDGAGDGDEVLKALRAKFKLADDASKEECMKALAGDDKDPPKDEEKDKGELKALSVMVLSLTKKIESLTQSTEAEKIEKLISENTDKIPLVAEGEFRKMSVAQLTSVLKVLPSQPRVATSKTQGDVVTLSADETAVAKSMGVTPEAYLESKKKIAEKKKEQAAN